MEKCLTIERELIKKYGFKCAMIYQFLLDNGGYWSGDIKELEELLYPLVVREIRYNMASLEYRGLISVAFKDKKRLIMVLQDENLKGIRGFLSVSKRILKEKSGNPLLGK